MMPCIEYSVRTRATSVSPCMSGVERPEIDGAGHRLVAAVVWMEVVAAVELRPEPGRAARVAGRSVKIRHGVEGSARAHEGIHGFAARLARLRPARGVFARAQKAP